MVPKTLLQTWAQQIKLGKVVGKVSANSAKARNSGEYWREASTTTGVKHFHWWQRETRFMQILKINSAQKDPQISETLQTRPLHSCQNGLETVCVQFQNKFSEHHRPHHLFGPQRTERLADWNSHCAAHHFGIVSTEPDLRLWKLCIYEPTKLSIWKWFWIFGCFLTNTVKTFTVRQLQRSYSAFLINTVEILF